MTTEHTVNASLRLTEAQDGFSFGTDALLLSAFVRPRRQGVAVDLGSGSGILSLLLQKKDSFARVYAVDVQAEYAGQDALIAQNAQENGLSGRVLPVCADVRDLSCADVGGEVDVVFSNPPYFTTEQGRPSASALRDTARHTTDGDIADFCAAAARLLKFGGCFFCVYTPQRLCDLLAAMREAGLEPKRLVLVQNDSHHPPFAVLAEGKKGAKPSMRTEVLTLYAPDGTRTPQYAAIQDEGKWEL